MVRINIKKDVLFGRTAYVISVNGKKMFFEFTKADAIKKVNQIKKKTKR